MNTNEIAKALSQSALQKAVFKTATGSILFQYPLWAIGGFLGVGFLFGFSFWLILACILLAGVSSFSWVIQMFFHDEKIKLKYIQRIKEKTQEEIERKNEQLVDDLYGVKLEDAAIQLQQFQNNFKNFIYILDQKFSPQELAYNRYYTIVQQIVLGGMNNLQTIFLRKKNLIYSNPKEVQKTLKKLQEIENPSKSQQTRIDELQKRLTIYEEETAEIDELLAQNDKALTAIDNVSRSIASINTDGNLSVNMENAMQDLVAMTEFTKVLDSNYSNAIKVK